MELFYIGWVGSWRRSLAWWLFHTSVIMFGLKSNLKLIWLEFCLGYKWRTFGWQSCFRIKGDRFSTSGYYYCEDFLIMMHMLVDWYIYLMFGLFRYIGVIRVYLCLKIINPGTLTIKIICFNIWKEVWWQSLDDDSYGVTLFQVFTLALVIWLFLPLRRWLWFFVSCALSALTSVNLVHLMKPYVVLIGCIIVEIVLSVVRLWFGYIYILQQIVMGFWIWILNESEHRVIMALLVEDLYIILDDSSVWIALGL